MTKYYFINPTTNILKVFYNSEDISLELWGADIAACIVVVENSRGVSLLPLVMTSFNVASLKVILESFEE
jgi:hypothetical protein